MLSAQYPSEGWESLVVGQYLLSRTATGGERRMVFVSFFVCLVRYKLKGLFIYFLNVHKCIKYVLKFWKLVVVISF